MPRQYVERLLASEGAVPGERRAITILFCDVKGSTAMSEPLDPEEVLEIMNGAFEAFLGPVHRYGGTPARLMGDAILCFFGAPVAHEDDPLRACRCALEILEQSSQYAMRLREERGVEDFAVRVGLNSGLVVVGEVGASSRFEYTAMGDAVNLAARVEALAEPGTILMTDTTQRLVQSEFQTELIGHVPVRGKTAPVATYRLIGARDQRVSRSLAVADSPTLVGRSTELESLLAFVTAGSWETLRVLAVTGDAGVGTTRLGDATRRRCSTSLQWVESECVPFETEVGYSSARHLLRALLESKPEHPDDHWRIALSHLMNAQRGSRLSPSPPQKGTDAAIREVDPCLAHILGCELGAAESERLRQMPADALSRSCARAFAEAVHRLVARRETVVVVDNMERMDTLSLRALDHLLTCPDSIPARFVLLFRQGEGSAWQFHDRWASKGAGWYSVLTIGPLGRDACGLLLREMFGEQPVSEAVVTHLLDRAEGNPFFLKELSRAVAGSRDVSLSDGVIDLPSSFLREIPFSLRGVITSRMDQLPVAAKSTLQAASVLGRDVWSRALAKMLENGTQQTDLNASLSVLIDRGFLEPVEGSSASDWDGEPHRVLRFQHPLSQEVAYASLLRVQRRELHRQAGESFQELLPEDHPRRSAALAHHFERAGMPAASLPHLVACARRAAGSWLVDEATAFYERAVAALPPSGSDRDSDPELPDPALVHIELGDLLFQRARYQGAMEQYERAETYGGSSAVKAQIARKRGYVRERWGQHEMARKCFEEALLHASLRTCPEELPRAYAGLSLVYHRFGRLDQAIQLGTMALRAMTEANDRRGQAEAGHLLAQICQERGELDEAIRYCEEASKVWDELADLHGLAASHNNLGLAYMRQGRYGEAQDCFSKSEALFCELNNPHGLSKVYDNLSEMYLVLGKDSESKEYLEKAVALLADLSVDETTIRAGMWRSGSI